MSATPTGAEAMKEAERLADAMRGDGWKLDRDELIDTFTRILPVEAQPAAVAGEADNRGVLQAVKQARVALHSHAMLPWGKPGYPTPTPGAGHLYEAKAYLDGALKREGVNVRALLAAAPAAPLVGEPPAYWFQTVLKEPTEQMVEDAGKYLNEEEPFRSRRVRLIWRAMLAAASPAAPAGVPTDDALEVMIAASDGHWREDVFCIGGPELMDLLRHAVGAGGVPTQQNSFHRSAADASEASGSAIPARPTMGDEEIIAIRQRVGGDGRTPWSDTLAFARALLAGGDQKAAPLHPSSVQAVDGDEPTC